MERREYRRIKKAHFGGANKIDLHGKSKEQALRALRAFVKASYHSGLREILVVTGRGRKVWEWGKPEGVLHRSLTTWLEDKEIAPYVIPPPRQANISHGGEGAWYVRLRSRIRSRSKG
ncbi:MAG: Smr/MutS family protein [Hyphomicrobiales bacterium]|nr:Smr/MutS family protein [Hyphomicrobiales bacterium]MCY4053431.1 Smr/MutS family protein [Hyphomicrobiales bacterium]